MKSAGLAPGGMLKGICNSQLEFRVLSGSFVQHMGAYSFREM